jgi:hypothetical protein
MGGKDKWKLARAIIIVIVYYYLYLCIFKWFGVQEIPVERRP